MAKTRKNIYEGMFILSATLSDDARTKALDRITSEITKKQGEVKKVFDQGRKKLAYQVKERKEGYYYVLYFDLPTLAMNDVWKEYHLNEDLMRFLTLRVESVPENLEFKPLIQE
jgi:small subunit ribosomal protein S6